MRSIDYLTGNHHARAEQRAFGNLIAPAQQIGVAEHLPHTRHTISDKESERVSHVPVHVHIPQPGNQELTGGVNDLRIYRHRDLVSDRRDAIPGDHDGHVTPGWRPGNIDDCDVREDYRRLTVIGLRPRE